MVRVNLIEPTRLCDQHLLAEYNEIQMLFGYINKHPEIDYSKISPIYKLGKGHIMFFKNKCKYLLRRLKILEAEMQNRGFQISGIDYGNLLRNIKDEHLSDWDYNQDDEKVIVERINEKLGYYENFYRYYGRTVGPTEAREILMKKETVVNDYDLK